MSANIIYNHVTTVRGEFYRLEVGCLSFIEEQSCQTACECIMYQIGDIAVRDLLINPLARYTISRTQEMAQQMDNARHEGRQHARHL
jgi:hypothetical protein